MEEFKEFGLTNNESKVYETLVKFGELSAGEVSSKSGVPYGRIYDVLDSLIEKGLVNIVPGKTKKFIPGNPKELEKILEKKKQEIAKAEEKVKALKKFYEDKGKNPVKLGIGIKAFYQILDDMEPVVNFDYSIKWSSEYNPKWVESVRKRNKKGVKSAVLTRFDEDNKKDVMKWLKVQKNMRKFSNDGVAMALRDNQVMISLIKSNVTLLIKDVPFAKIMKKLFEDSYSKAKEIK